MVLMPWPSWPQQGSCSLCISMCPVPRLRWACTPASNPSASLHAGCWQWLTSQTLCSKPSAALEPPFPLHAHIPDYAHLCPTCTSPGPLLHSSGMLPSCPPTPDQLWTGKITKLPCHPVSWITPSPKRFETQPLEGGPPFHDCPSLGTLS